MSLKSFFKKTFEKVKHAHILFALAQRFQNNLSTWYFVCNFCLPLTGSLQNIFSFSLQFSYYLISTVLKRNIFQENSFVKYLLLSLIPELYIYFNLLPLLS